ncbi:hypothetical protein ABT160_34930, partial [Streptomyces sp. NPDC001941]
PRAHGSAPPAGTRRPARARARSATPSTTPAFVPSLPGPALPAGPRYARRAAWAVVGWIAALLLLALTLRGVAQGSGPGNVIAGLVLGAIALAGLVWSVRAVAQSGVLARTRAAAAVGILLHALLVFRSVTLFIAGL